MNWTTFFQKVGRLEERASQQATDTKEIKAELRDIKSTVSNLKSFQDRQRGMWFAVATIAATVGALVTIAARWIGALVK
jgi:chaperonin cofactor prefoldin